VLASFAVAKQAAPQAIGTDRPTDSAAPSTVPRYAVQFETGYKFTRSSDVDTHLLPDLLVRFGLHTRLEARFTSSGWSFENRSSTKRSGFNDVSVGAKVLLSPENGRRPALSLLGDVGLPVGAENLTDEFVKPELLLLLANTLPKGLSLTYNIGTTIVTSRDDDGQRRTRAQLKYNGALSGPLTESTSWFGELFGALPLSDTFSARHSAQAGVLALLSEDIQLDARTGVGLVNSVPDWLVGLGVSFRLTR
jgi:hypothetical protein